MNQRDRYLQEASYCDKRKQTTRARVLRKKAAALVSASAPMAGESLTASEGVTEEVTE